MKRTILIIAYTIFLAGFCKISFSQMPGKNCIGYSSSGNSLSAKSPADTLMPASFYSGKDTFYTYYDNIRYPFGTNVLEDKVEAQVYRVAKSYYIDGVALWVGAKVQVGSADTVFVNMYELDGPGTDTSGPVNNAPHTVMTTLTVPDSLINTTGLTILSFPSPFIVYNDYAVGIDFSYIKNDTIGLITTRDGDAHKSQLSWNKPHDNTWESVLCSLNWGMDIDFGIFIIADTSTANINDNYFIDGIKLSQNQPNPASGSTLVQYEIQNDAGNVSLEIYSVSGNRLLIYNEDNQVAGRHDIQLDVKKLESGVYYYSLKAGNHRLTKKMVICN